MLSVCLCDKFLLLTSSILTSKIKKDQTNDNRCTKNDGPGKDILFEVFFCPKEESDEYSQHSYDRSKNINAKIDDFLTLERVVVVRYRLPDWIGLSESSFVFEGVENSLS